MSEDRKLPRPLRLALMLSLVLLSGLAAALSMPGPAREAIAIPAESIWLIQWFLGFQIVAILTGWAVNHRARRANGLTLVRRLLVFVVRLLATLLLYGTAILDLFLAGNLIFDWSPDRAWLLGLLIPAASSFWLWLHVNSAHAEQPDNDTPAPAEALPQGAPETPGRILRGSGLEIALSMIWIAILLTGFLAGSIAFALLRRVLFEDAVFTTGVLPAMTRTAAWVEALIPIAVAPIVIGLVFGVIAIGRALVLKTQTCDPERYNRPLTDADYAFLDGATEALSQYSESQKYPWIWYLSPFVLSLGGIAVGIAICFAAAYGLMNGLHALVVPVDATEDLLLPLSSFGVGMLVAIFSGIVLCWPLTQLLPGLHARFAEHLYLRHGWNTMNSRGRNEADFRVELERDLRLDRLSTNKPFDPASYILFAFRRLSKASRTSGGIALAVCLSFATLDGLAYQAFTEERAYQSGYFSLARNAYRYEDAVRIETSCYMGRSDGEPVLVTRYQLVMPDDVQLNLGDLLTPDGLADLEAVDRKAASGGAERTDGPRRGAGQAGRPPRDPECLSALERSFGEETERVRQLLGV